MILGIAVKSPQTETETASKMIVKIISLIHSSEKGLLYKLFSDKHRRIGVEASGMDVFGKVFCKVMRPILLGKYYKTKSLSY